MTVFKNSSINSLNRSKQKRRFNMRTLTRKKELYSCLICFENSQWIFKINLEVIKARKLERCEVQSWECLSIWVIWSFCTYRTPFMCSWKQTGKFPLERNGIISPNKSNVSKFRKIIVIKIFIQIYGMVSQK